MARQKKPKQLFDDTNALTLASTNQSVVAEFLKRVSFNMARRGNKFRQVYQYIRDVMVESLTDKQRQDPIYASLIERIARMSVILDKIERHLYDQIEDMTQSEVIDSLGDEYLHYLREYRSFIESFSNLKWAGDVVQKTRKIEKIREIQREEVNNAK